MAPTEHLKFELLKQIFSRNQEIEVKFKKIVILRYAVVLS